MRELDRLTACECCEGITSLVPARLENRPGLSALAWRIGTHSQFKTSMLAEISRRDRLRELGLRSNDDFTNALIDAWAVTLDVLAFYQERIANEAYLRTALERRSLLELARLIGYELRPGLAAGVLLAFLLDSAPGSPAQVAIPELTPAQSIPTKEEVPQTFETTEELFARPRWNLLTPRLTVPQVFDGSTRSFYLKGTSANLRLGDPVLLVTGEDGDTQTLLRVQSVKLEPEKARTLLSLSAEPAPHPVYEAIGMVFPSPPIGSFGTVVSAVQGSTLSATGLQTVLTIGGQSMDDLIDSLAAIRNKLPDPPKPGAPGLYVLRTGASPFGANAPKYLSTPRDWRPSENGGWASHEFAPYPNDWDENGWPITRDSRDNDYGSGRTIYLEQELKGIVPDDWLVLVSRSKGAGVYQVEETAVESIADFGLSGKSTRLVLKSAPGGAAPVGEIKDYLLRETTVLTVSQYLELAELPIEMVEAGTDVLEIEEVVPDLVPGRRVVLTGERVGEYEGVHNAEGLELLDVGQGVFTTLTFTKPIQFDYRRATVRLYANVAPATHGESGGEVLGSGDSSREFQSFTLRRDPLTYVSSADSPTGGADTLEVRVNGILWHEAPSFYQLGPKDRRYVLRLDDKGKTSVLFGDGKYGLRLPSGEENVVATYRSGLGTPGLVGAGRIALLPRKPLGVREVLNPLPSLGAQDAETLDRARRNAPLTVRTLDRVVSLTDFEDFAGAFGGIGKARADWVWAGGRYVVHVTVGAPNGGDISDEVLANLVESIDKTRIPHQPVQVAPYEKLFFKISADLKIDPDFEDEDVLEAAETALRGTFDFDARQFAQRVAVSHALAVLQDVAGVIAVNLKSLVFDLETGGNIADDFGLPVRGARFDRTERHILPAQLLVISPAPVDLRKMS
jgi:hypothetical protein